jgi:hypothetical protein
MGHMPIGQRPAPLGALAFNQRSILLPYKIVN